METTITSNLLSKTLAIALASIAWFAVILDYSISKESTVTFFSYFTILSNLLVAVSFSASFLGKDSMVGRFMNGFRLRSALTLYIIIVGFVYNFVLRDTWAQPVLNFISNNLLHIVIPVLTLTHWALFTQRPFLTWRNGLEWLIFPLVFLVYSLIRGIYTDWYPYPFLNVLKLGYGQVLLNAVLVTLGFLVTGFLMIGFNRHILPNSRIQEKS